MEMNVYYYNDEVVCKQSNQMMNKKKVFPLLYNVQKKNLAVFDININENGCQKNITHKVSYIGYKKQQNQQGQEKHIICVEKDNTWINDLLENIKNKMNFCDNNINLKGFVFYENEEQDIENKINEQISNMKEEAFSYIQNKIKEFNNYNNMLA